MDQYSKKQIFAENLRKDIELTQLMNQLVELQGRLDTQSANDKETIASLNNEVGLAKEKAEKLNEQIMLLNEEIRKKELSRFASAYSNQENEYRIQQDLWFKRSLWSTFFLTASVLYSSFGSQLETAKLWYQEPSFYLLNFIFITLFVYSLKQHTHLGNLRIDYANRKTLAQSYQHIIEDEEEFEGIKSRFLERASDVFSSPPLFRSSEVTPHESFLRKITGNKNE
ncbi:MAG: hypothetical protein UW27_C0002G0089 [Parcubacteria group bacterium GW2011_GWA1_44_13]|uniref:SMODS and SLOG-associating 2TM effector domain-containing protein n=1 Tax=Candidatus Nomurabacteria bacterium GW2011_GWB1_44_12 TaxID=1618748 RepID=A0A837IBU0_9BACT|nr:MAG: hypothetical protein UW25_C0002G0090 [Candidatus Nomurabacteria bacterium GW2011_GWB1_44_12]KKT38439.1 MAG: hypothetical protein UW27_C0002G0089 [Parcubacteria group bacterium GW2011_GWA1_44_13]KKT59347.1 MAG: hypothetical protein UW54_C0028G0002 [Parcubacteria group bacterium GW2011_GWC1_44_26]HBB43983.1 hypothetical protein [Candidatus Yonathbacteria bacterium]